LTESSAEAEWTNVLPVQDGTNTFHPPHESTII